MPRASGRKASIAENLADMLGRQIADGVLRAGDKLPSLRALAQLHGYAKNTVVAAFELLVSRGLVQARRGSGFYVLAQRPAALPAGDDSAPLQRAMDVVWLMREQLKTRPDALALGDGFPPVDWLADMRLDRYHQKVVRTGLGALFRYGSRMGYAPLRDSLVRKLGMFGLEVSPQQLLLTQGANDALDLVIRHWVAPGATVLVDDPGYYLLFGKLKLAGARVLGVPRQADGPDVAALERLLQTERPRLFYPVAGAQPHGLGPECGQGPAHLAAGEPAPAADRGERPAGRFQANLGHAPVGAGPAGAHPLHRQFFQVVFRRAASGLHRLPPGSGQ